MLAYVRKQSILGIDPLVAGVMGPLAVWSAGPSLELGWDLQG